MAEQNNGWQGQDRRQTPRQKDVLYKSLIAFTAAAWCTLVVALVLFHFARPEFATGVQEYWGVESREGWDEALAQVLLWTLYTCLTLSVLSLVLRTRRTRRKKDRFGFSLIVLVLIVAISLFTLNTVL